LGRTATIEASQNFGDKGSTTRPKARASLRLIKRGEDFRRGRPRPRFQPSPDVMPGPPMAAWILHASIRRRRSSTSGIPAIPSRIALARMSIAKVHPWAIAHSRRQLLNYILPLVAAAARHYQRTRRFCHVPVPFRVAAILPTRVNLTGTSASQQRVVRYPLCRRIDRTSETAPPCQQFYAVPGRKGPEFVEKRPAASPGMCQLPGLPACRPPAPERRPTATRPASANPFGRGNHCIPAGIGSTSGVPPCGRPPWSVSPRVRLRRL
jgi:hypothetical protein